MYGRMDETQYIIIGYEQTVFILAIQRVRGVFFPPYYMVYLLQ